MLSKKAMERSNKLFENFTIINAMIASKDRLVLITKNTGEKDADLKSDAELKTKFILYNKNYNKEKLGINSKFWEQGIERAWGGFVGDDNKPTIFCDLDANICEFTSDEKWVQNTGWKELPISQVEFPMIRSCLGCINIDNDIYIFGALRKLYKRVGKQKWQDLTDETKHPNLHADLVMLLKQSKGLSSANVGFLSVDGFNKHDIYGVGDAGDIWHYDGEIWIRLDSPTNFDMRVVLCAPDGYVYIAGTIGKIIKGRLDKEQGESWEILESPTTEMIHSLAWFKGKVYIGVEYGLYTIDKNGKIEEYQFPETGPHQYSFRNVVACEEALLSYGANQALIFNGESWETIVGKIIVSLPEAFINLIDS